MDKSCKNCKQSFHLEQEDLDFYKKMEAPTPNFCPPCRAARRLAFRNERTLYRRNCSMTGKSIISLYPENTPFPVYEQHIFRGDDWNAMDYGQDYDPKRPFFDQFLELKNKVPRSALLTINCVNTEFANNIEDSKNCYLVFAAQKNEDCLYGRLMYRNKFVVDGAFVADSELCYECIDLRKCYKCFFTESSETSADLYFCFDMRDCQNCIFSTNLRHKSYHIFNKSVTKEEFEAKKKDIFSSYEKLEEAKKIFEEEKKKATVKYAHQIKCINTTGDYLFNCHSSTMAFDSENSKNCKYIADAETPLDCYDLNNTYYNPELCLDLMGVLRMYNSKHCVYTFYSSNLEYCDNVENSESCFGCVGLRKKKFCILNKEYSKEEYEKIKGEIVESMKRDGVYGDFLPPALSPYGYNESLAAEYYPLEKDEAKEKGFNWQNETSGTYGKETIKESEMPNAIDEVNEDILNAVLVCKDCNKNFRITRAEYDFYKRIGVPIPHKDFECRHQDRMKKRNPRKLWTRECMCALPNHPLHTNKSCENKFETSYSPDRREKIFCEHCYQQEVS
jgi:hypothetical protein